MTDVDIGNTSVVTLPTILDQSAAEGLLLSLRTATDAGGSVILDASFVEALSLPCIQVLLAAARSCTALTIANPSTVFVEVFDGLSLKSGLTFSEMSDMPSSRVDNRPLAEAAAPLAEPSLPASEPAAATGAAKRILTIDDSKTMRDMLMLTLSGSGFEVLQAIDGQDGIDVLQRESVDVIITDINMPKMDGYGVIQHLRGDPSYDSTPILVLTTESDREKKERARELGATGFIVKPFNPETLVEVIRKVSP